MTIVAWPPVVQRFMRGKTWYNIISTTPFDVFKYLLYKQPVLGAMAAYGLYYYGWKKVWIDGLANREERWKRNYRTDLHYQENIDWETEQNRDEMREFIEINKMFGSFEAAVKDFCKKTGTPEPTFVVKDPVWIIPLIESEFLLRVQRST
eukprot:UN05484